MKKFYVVLLVAALCGVVALILGTGLSYGQGGDLSSSAESSVFLGAKIDITRTDSEPTGTSRVTADGEPVPPVLPCFWFYVQKVRGLDPDGRERELYQPASILQEMDVRVRRRLGVRDMNEVHLKFLWPGEAHHEVPTRLLAELFRIWSARASITKEDLAGALLQVWTEETHPRLELADPAMLSLCYNGFAYCENGTKRFVPAVYEALKRLPDKLAKEQAEGVVSDSLIYLANAAGDLPWLRPQALALIGEPWMPRSKISIFVTILCLGGTFEEWRMPLHTLLSNKNAAEQWAAVEALRSFAAKQEHPISAGQLVQTIPTELYSSPYGSVRMAVIEAVAQYGGDPGKQRLMAFLLDRKCKYRATVLFFLAANGKLDATICTQLLQDESLRDAAIDALGQTARRSDAAVQVLVHLVRSSADPEQRKLALRALSQSGRDTELLALCKSALDDVAPSVRLEAVRQIAELGATQRAWLQELATDSKRAPEVRRRAFEGLVLHSSDKDLPKIANSMYQDSDTETREQGYLLKAGLAVAMANPDALQTWNQLPIPKSIMQAAKERSVLASLNPKLVRDYVVREIRQGMERMLDPRFRFKVRQNEILNGGGRFGSSILRKKFEFPRRILALLDRQRKRNKK